MKQPKKLTRAQKSLLRDNSMNPNNYMLVEDKQTILVLQDKGTKAIKTVSKVVRKR